MLFDLDEDYQDEAFQDKKMRQRWNVNLLQIAKEIVTSFSPSPQQCGSHTKNSAQQKWGKTRREKTGKPVSSNVESGEKLIKEEASDACARPHSGIMLPVINKLNNDSKEDDNNSKRNKTDNKNTTCIGDGGFSMPSPDNNCEGSINYAIGGGLLIDTQLSSDAVNENSNNNDSTSGISGLRNNHKN